MRAATGESRRRCHGMLCDVMIARNGVAGVRAPACGARRSPAACVHGAAAGEDRARATLFSSAARTDAERGRRIGALSCVCVYRETRDGGASDSEREPRSASGIRPPARPRRRGGSGGGSATASRVRTVKASAVASTKNNGSGQHARRSLYSTQQYNILFAHRGSLYSTQYNILFAEERSPPSFLAVHVRSRATL